jgi:NAD(P)H-hydrate epimerase
MDAGDLAALQRRPDGNKGTFGKALIIAGNRGSCGAALLCARAAFRAGAGMVRLFTPEANRVIIQESLPEAMLTVYDPEETEETREALRKAMEWADLTAAGPGMGTDRTAAGILRTVLTEYGREGAAGRLVLDADALRMIADDETLADLLAAHASGVSVILTPHLGEFAALAHCTAAEAADRRFDLSDQLARRYHAAVICKDARTLVTGEDLRHFMNTAGNDGMATAGSGDVLTGIAAAFSMQEKEPFRAACFAVLVHALAGDAAAEHTGRSAMMAGDISEALQNILP